MNRAPSPGVPLRVEIQGWRRYVQSLALINQNQCLALLDRPEVALTHLDLPPPPASMLRKGAGWEPLDEILGAEADRRVRAIPAPSPGDRPDVTYRIAFPYDFRAAPHGRTLVFAITETGGLPPFLVRGPGLAEASRQDGFGLVTPSEWSKAGLVASGAEPSRVAVVPLGFDPGVFRPAAAATRAEMRARAGWTDRLVFLGVGAMYPHKGIVALLRAFAAIAEAFPQARLALKGNEAVYASREALRAAMESLTSAQRDRVASRLEFVGRSVATAGVARLCQSADALVAPYHAEGFCLPVVEAAACGLPVICTAGGPTDETTTEAFALRVPSTRGPNPNVAWGGTWLFPDLDALVASMRRVAVDEDWVRGARAAGPPHVGRYAWPRVVDALLPHLA